MTVIARVRVLTAAALLAVAGPAVASQASPPPAHAAPAPAPAVHAAPPSQAPAVHAAPAPLPPIRQSGGPSTIAMPRSGTFVSAVSAASSSGSSGPSRGGSASHPSHPSGPSHGGSTATVTRGETHGRTAEVRPAAVNSGSVPRARGDRTAVGTAVDRTGPPPHGGHYPGYYPPYYYYPAAGFIWDPFWWGYGAGYGYGDPTGGYPGYGGGGGDPGGSDVYGSLKLKVKPSDAQVYVDGYFSGLVDDYDGLFQKLNLEVGAHHIEIRADGYETLAFDVRIEYDQTVTYKGEMQKLPTDGR
jgi:PEGA domain